MQELNLYEPKEAEAISFTYTVANPGTVVIMCRHTMITSFAVLATKRLFNVTYRTVLVLNEEIYFFVFILIFLLIAKVYIDINIRNILNSQIILLILFIISGFINVLVFFLYCVKTLNWKLCMNCRSIFFFCFDRLFPIFLLTNINS